MRSMRRRFVTGALAAVAVGGLLVGCTSEPDAPEPTPTGTQGGDVEVIEPLDSIAGATVTEIAGISLAVPEGFAGEPVEVDNGITQLALTRDGAERAEAYLTVTVMDGLTDGDVEAASQLSATQLAGALEDMTRSRATWEGFGPAFVVRGTLVLDSGNRDVVLVTTRDERGSRIVGASAEAPEGELEDSVGFEVLRTVRAAG